MNASKNTPAIIFDNLAAGYGHTPLLRDISFSLFPGQNIGILGPNGSGKTTLLRCIASLATIFAGQIIINGSPNGQISARQLARQLAASAAASPPMPGFTVRQYVLLGRYPWLGWLGHHSRADYKISDQALSACGIAHLADQQAATLSQGQRQLAALARSLAQIWQISNPILILDEQTASLDLNRRLEVSFLLERWRRKPSAILQAIHDCNLAALTCTHLLGLKNGRQLFFGPTEEVFTQENLSELYSWPLGIAPHPHLRRKQVFARLDPDFLPPPGNTMPGSPGL